MVIRITEEVLWKVLSDHFGVTGVKENAVILVDGRFENLFITEEKAQYITDQYRVKLSSSSPGIATVYRRELKFVKEDNA